MRRTMLMPPMRQQDLWNTPRLKGSNIRHKDGGHTDGAVSGEPYEKRSTVGAWGHITVMNVRFL